MKSLPNAQPHMKQPSALRSFPLGLTLACALAMVHAAAAQQPLRTTANGATVEATARIEAEGATPSLNECPDGLTPAERTRLVTVQRTLADDKPHAALALLDAIRQAEGVPVLDVLRAEAFRKIRRLDQAKALLNKVKDTCLAGRVQHSLGLIAALEGKESDSIRHLEQASRAMPIDPQIRNDLGYAYMAAGRYDDALFELSTAHELAPDFSKAVHNLIVLSHLRGEGEMTDQLLKQYAINTVVANRLAQAAQRLKRSPPFPTVNAPFDEKGPIQ